jgi:hypothetical protein
MLSFPQNPHHGHLLCSLDCFKCMLALQSTNSNNGTCSGFKASDEDNRLSNVTLAPSFVSIATIQVAKPIAPSPKLPMKGNIRKKKE